MMGKYEERLIELRDAPNWNAEHVSETTEVYAEAAKTITRLRHELEAANSGQAISAAVNAFLRAARNVSDVADPVSTVDEGVEKANEALDFARRAELPEGHLSTIEEALIRGADAGARITFPGWGLVRVLPGTDPVAAANAALAEHREERAKVEVDRVETYIGDAARALDIPGLLDISDEKIKKPVPPHGDIDDIAPRPSEPEFVSRVPQDRGGYNMGGYDRSGSGSGSGGYVPAGNARGVGAGGSGGSGGGGDASGAGALGAGAGGGAGGGSGAETAGGSGAHGYGSGSGSAVHASADSELSASHVMGLGLLGSGAAAMGGGGIAGMMARTLPPSMGGIAGLYNADGTPIAAAGSGSAGSGGAGGAGGMGARGGPAPITSYSVGLKVTNPDGTAVTPESLTRSSSSTMGRGLLGSRDTSPGASSSTSVGRGVVGGSGSKQPTKRVLGSRTRYVVPTFEADPIELPNPNGKAGSLPAHLQSKPAPPRPPRVFYDTPPVQPTPEPPPPPAPAHQGEPTYQTPLASQPPPPPAAYQTPPPPTHQAPPTTPIPIYHVPPAHQGPPPPPPPPPPPSR